MQTPPSADKYFFTADLHLSRFATARSGLARAFFDMVQQERGRLYILGDLFDFWANNRSLIRLHREVFDALQKLTHSGCFVGMISGNRDFLLGERTLRPLGIRFLGEEAEVGLGSLRAWITHGHTLCLNDAGFLRYRQRIWPLFKMLDRVLPGCIENRIAGLCMQRSKKVIRMQDQSRFQFAREAIIRRFDDGIDVVICGHRHEDEQFMHRGHRFFALPAWQDHAAPYVLYAGGSFSVREFRLQPSGSGRSRADTRVAG